MKTYYNTKDLRTSIVYFVLIIVIVFTTLVKAHAQVKEVFNHDYLMPQKGTSMVEFYSGLPYVAIGQYSYGFSNHFSVGVIYGYTPFEKGYGLRMKAILAQPSESFRINVKSPFIYYPGMKKIDGEPWMAAWPAINGEWKFKNGSRIWTGVGLMGAACVDVIFPSKEHDHGGHEHGDSEHDEHKPKGPNHDPGPTTPPGVTTTPFHVIETPMQGKGEMKMYSLFNTFQFGYSKPLSNSWSFVAEVAPVMEGFKLKSPNGFLDTTPVVLTAGLSGSF